MVMHVEKNPFCSLSVKCNLFACYAERGRDGAADGQGQDAELLFEAVELPFE
jgi:hypothetical protein